MPNFSDESEPAATRIADAYCAPIEARKRARDAERDRASRRVRRFCEAMDVEIPHVEAMQRSELDRSTCIFLDWGAHRSWSEGPKVSLYADGTMRWYDTSDGLNSEGRFDESNDSTELIRRLRERFSGFAASFEREQESERHHAEWLARRNARRLEATR